MADAETNVERIAAALHNEQEALERLCYTLEVQRLALDAARADLLAEAGRDVETALDSVRRADLLRAVTVSAVHVAMVRELEQMGVAANGYPTLGQIASACGGARATLLISQAGRLKKSLARAMALADENGKRLDAARERLADDELAMWSDTWAQEFDDAVEDFLASIDHPSTAAQLLDDVEQVLFEEEDEQLATALSDLRLQAVSFEAALGVLQTVGCRPLLEFIADVDAD